MTGEPPAEPVDPTADPPPADPGLPRRRPGHPPGTPVYRTGAEQPWDPEDLAVAKGRDPTPRNIERARQELERDGPAAIERTVP
jgi:hypothetical protein